MLRLPERFAFVTHNQEYSALAEDGWKIKGPLIARIQRDSPFIKFSICNVKVTLGRVAIRWPSPFLLLGCNPYLPCDATGKWTGQCLVKLKLATETQSPLAFPGVAYAF